MKNALIIGASSGIGQTLAWELAQQENLAKIFIVARRTADLKITQEKYPDKISAIQADIATTTAIELIVAKLDAAIDLLILNAAIESPVLPFEKIPLKDFKATLDINLTSYFYLLQQLVLKEKLAPNARILFVSTGLDRHSMEGLLTYGTSKAALYYFSQGLKNEAIIKKQKLLLGICNPGVTETPMQQRLRNNSDNPTQQAFLALYEQGQVRSPNEIAKFFAWVLLETSAQLFTQVYWELSNNFVQAAWQQRDATLLTSHLNLL